MGRFQVPRQMHLNKSVMNHYLFYLLARNSFQSKVPWSLEVNGIMKTATFHSPQVKGKRAVSDEQKMKKTIREVCISYQAVRGSFITAWNDSCTNTKETSFGPYPLWVLAYSPGAVSDFNFWILSRCWSLFAYKTICSADYFARSLLTRL